MIAITRLLARRLGTVFRRSSLGLPPLSTVPPLLFHTAEDRLRVRHRHETLTVECVLSAAGSAAFLALPLDALFDVAGNDLATVVLETSAPGRTLATWSVGGIPQVREYAVPACEGGDPFAPLPDAPIPLKAASLEVLAEAAGLAGDAAGRGEPAQIWLRGRTSDVLAAGGGQILVQAEFPGPWEGDLAVHLAPLWHRPGRPRGRPASWGGTGTSVVFRIGPWTILETITEGTTSAGSTARFFADWRTTGRIRLEVGDVHLLARALHGLGRDVGSVVLKLDAHLVEVTVSRPGSSEACPTRLSLGRSHYTGPPTRVTSDAQALARAMRLGISTLDVDPAEGRIIGRTARRTLAWGPLIRPNEAVGVGEHAVPWGTLPNPLS